MVIFLSHRYNRVWNWGQRLLQCMLRQRARSCPILMSCWTLRVTETRNIRIFQLVDVGVILIPKSKDNLLAPAPPTVFSLVFSYVEFSIRSSNFASWHRIRVSMFRMFWFVHLLLLIGSWQGQLIRWGKLLLNASLKARIRLFLMPPSAEVKSRL